MTTSELWLSTNDNPVNKVKIASVPDWTDSREWNKYPSQKSAAHHFDSRSALLCGGVAKGRRRWRQPCGGVGQAGPIDLRAERGDSRFGPLCPFSGAVNGRPERLTVPNPTSVS